MTEMTPQRARKLALRWALAGFAAVPVMAVLVLLDLGQLNWLVAAVASGLCFTQMGLWAGWARGCEDAARKLAHSVRCDEVCPPLFLGDQDHEHRCAHPALDCVPERGRPEHLCRCGMSWIPAKIEKIELRKRGT